ncbi:S1 family peptidase [Micromonospora maritima]|uniref:S1 family peptidase n=1 Tax=Micromonospora maritima TaxID=986711 RepID=A0ABW7ZLG5_9ACTN
MKRAILLDALAALLMLALPGASAAAGPPAPAPVPTGMVQAMKRDLGLSDADVRVRLDGEARAGRTDARLRADLGSAYAGSWVSGTRARLTVAVTDAGRAAVARRFGARVTVVRHSAAALATVKRALDRASAVPPAATVPGWYVDVRSNSVVVLANGDERDAAAFVAAAGVRGSAVEVVRTDEAPRPLHDIRGGDAYYPGPYRCSIGFPVGGGFVTAGHCGSTGTPTDGFNRVTMGRVAGSSFPGNDYGWVRTESTWTPRPWVNDYAGGVVAVAGSAEAAVGASVCRSGSTTGWHCGTIQAKDSTVNYPDGVVTGLTRTNACAEKGDSGGSWLSGDQAQGVTSGGSGNCGTGGTTYFQPVGEILGAYGLTLVTTGGGTPNPPPPGPDPITCPADLPNKRTGTLAAGTTALLPWNSGFTAIQGEHTACVVGPAGTDFDLYLERFSISTDWTVVARSTGSGSTKKLRWTDAYGSYRYRVVAAAGAGAYTLTYRYPG